MKKLIIITLLLIYQIGWAEDLNLVCDVTVTGELSELGAVNQKTKASISFREGTLNGEETTLGDIQLMDIELEGQLTKGCTFYEKEITCYLNKDIHLKAINKDIFMNESLKLNRKTGFLTYKLLNNMNKLNSVTVQGECKKAEENRF